ncbi:hypothetical protein AAFF_G00151680 [Aldrovandia affinis]|uniref:C1q domain-containing protein n=1 Tax=Aldrovandia affinis TaxID=143900 RepID=A0AAD7RP69_9TELE|nr:hypothetical protein AAFF_G00151680 [Aldrovandia affinis]
MSVAQKSPTEPISCQPDIYTQLRELRAQVESMRIECGDTSAVAFSASLLDTGRGHAGPFNTDTVLIFKNIITNNGNAYYSNTEKDISKDLTVAGRQDRSSVETTSVRPAGVFTAPVGGLYYFSFSSQSTGP